VFEKNMFKTKAVTPLWFGKTCLITSGHTARVENKTCKKKSGHPAEVLVFEKNMFKTKAVTPLWFGFGKKHVERSNTHPRKIFFWYKRMHQNKKRPHRYVFLSHQNKGRNKKRTHRYTCDQKNATIPKKNANSLILPSSNLTITWLPVSSAPFEQQRVSSSWPCSKLPCHGCHLPAGCGSQDPLAEVAAPLALGKNLLRSTCRRECNIYHVRFCTASKKTHG
jgi:hypothetical protein